MDLNSYNYLEYGDNNTTASGSIGSCERFLMGENLEHFHIPSYYAEAKYDDVIAYIPKKSECIWYWVKRNGNRNAAILSCYYSPNKGKGQAAENCNQFFHFNFHNNTASLSLNHTNIPAVSIDVYRKMLQFLLDFGIDCTLRIIPASVDPTYCLLIMANILNTLPACIADKISYTIHASAKTTSTFSFLAEEEWKNSQQKIDCRTLKTEPKNSYIEYLICCIQNHQKCNSYESIVNPETNPPLTLYQLLYQLFEEKRQSVSSKIIKNYAKYIRMEEYNRQLAAIPAEHVSVAQSVIPPKSNSQRVASSHESPPKFNSPVAVNYRDIRHPNAGCYIPKGLEPDEEPEPTWETAPEPVLKSIQDSPHPPTPQPVYTPDPFQNTDFVQTESDNKKHSKSKRKFFGKKASSQSENIPNSNSAPQQENKKKNFLKKILPLSVCGILVLGAVTGFGIKIILDKDSSEDTSQQNSAEAADDETAAEETTTLNYESIAETTEPVYVQEATTEESTEATTTASETTTEVTSTETETSSTVETEVSKSDNIEDYTERITEMANDLDNESRRNSIKCSEKELQNIVNDKGSEQREISASETYNLFDRAKNYQVEELTNLSVYWENNVYDVVYEYNATVKGYCFLLKENQNIAGYLYTYTPSYGNNNDIYFGLYIKNEGNSSAPVYYHIYNSNS
mgnify:CR=1 FL=1